MLKSKKRKHRNVGMEPEQFDFEQNWDSMIAPHLNDRHVVTALTLGMKLYDQGYTEGEPPWKYGAGNYLGWHAVKGHVTWYQPLGLCHSIAPFCWALGQKLFPELKWGFVSSDTHTVVVGWSRDWNQPEWVMDILFFQVRSAAESLARVKKSDWQYSESLTCHVAWCYVNPESTYRSLMKEKKKAGFLPGVESVEWIEKLIALHESNGATPMHLTERRMESLLRQVRLAELSQPN